METHEKLSSFTNEIRRSMPVRKKTGLADPIPSLDMFCSKAESDSERSSYYWTPILDLIRTKKVYEVYARLHNYAVECSWINMAINQIEKNITVDFFENIEKIKNGYINIAKDNQIDISEELKILDQKVLLFKNDEITKQGIKEILELKETMNRLSDTIITIENYMRTEEVDIQQGRQSFNPDITTTPWLKPLNEFIDTNMQFLSPYLDKKHFYDFAPVTHYFNDINESLKNVYQKFGNIASFCMADGYRDAFSSQSAANFILQKKNKENIRESYEFSIGKYKEIIRFKDNSFLAKDDKNNYIDILDNEDLRKVLYSIMESEIRYDLRKNPTLTKDFLRIFNKELDNYKDLNKVITNYLKNEDILKLCKYNVVSDYKEHEKNQKTFHSQMEKMDDRMHAIVREHKIKQLAHSIASNKYMHLYNDETYNLIGAIYDLKLENGVFQDYIGKKIAAYKTPEEFNEALLMFANAMGNFGSDAMYEKACEVNADVIFRDENSLIVQITDYDQSMALGSPSWCIVRDGGYFESYVEDGNRQYFIYDFTKIAADNASIIGITLHSNDDVYTAHLKNDDQIESDSPIVEKLVDIILKAELEETPVIHRCLTGSSPY